MGLLRNVLSPKVTVTAPDGETLYLDPLSDTGESSPVSLWPAGFRVGIRPGAVPVDDPKATDSPSTFLIHQAPTLLRAPGPYGISWGGWLALTALAGGAAVWYLRRR